MHIITAPPVTTMSDGAKQKQSQSLKRQKTMAKEIKLLTAQPANQPEQEQEQTASQPEQVEMAQNGISENPLEDLQAEVFEAEDIEWGAVKVDAENIEIDASEILTREQFCKNFKDVFGVTSAFTGLQSLKIAPHEEEKADEAANAIYDIAVESEYMRFIISPSSLWLQRVSAIGIFAVYKSVAVKKELAERNRLKKEQPKPAEIVQNVQ